MVNNEGLPPHSENVEEELQRIKHALQTVFSPAHNSQSSDPAFHRHDLANRYLISFQCLPIAWMVCDQLLLQEHDDSNSFFFAAQTLHFKCREEVYIAQLPPNSLPSLRDSLMNHLIRFAVNPPSTALITRLCMTIAALSVQMNWNSIVSDLLENVRERPELGPVILELIQLIPEETCSDRLYLPSEKLRFDFRESLRACSQPTLEFLVQFMNASNSGSIPSSITQQERILRCFHSWIRHVDIPPLLLQNTPLLDASFQVLTNLDAPIFESAVDVIVEILRQYGSEPRSHAGLVQKMIPMVMHLGNTTFRNVLHDENSDALRGYCRIFTEVGESYMSLIVSPQEMNQIELVELILRCSAIPDHEIANITLNFWYHFVTSLETLEPYEYRQDRIDYYTAILLKFLQICVNLLKYPEDLEELQIDQVEDIERDRHYVGESVEDCCRLLGGDIVLNNVGQRIQQEVNHFKTFHPNQQTQSWQGIEASFYALHSISGYIPSDENQVLPFVMGLFADLPRSLSKLRLTVNVAIGNYATWLGKHTQYLGALLPLLAEGLNTQGCASSSAVAIKQICKCCTQQPLGDSVLQLYDGIVEAANKFNATGGGGVFPVELRDELQVLEGTCLAVSRQLESDPNTVTIYMNRIVHPIITRLSSLLSAESQCNAKQLVSEIERLTVIVRFLDPPPLSAEEKYDEDGDEQSARHTMIIPLMSQSWSLLDAVAHKFPADPNVAEKLCRLHKHSMRGCGQKYISLLDKLMATLVQNFQHSFQSPYLYAASICISDFSHKPELVPALFQMISQLSSTVFARLNTLDDFTAHPDVVEEFFYLLGRCMSYCPNPIVISPLLNSFLQCAVVGMHVQHKDSNKGTLTFLEHTISYGITLTYHSDPGDPDAGPTTLQCKEALEKVIMKEGQAIVTNLAKALLGELPLYSHSLDRGSGSIAGIIYQMNDLCPELLLQWMSEALKQAPDPAKTEFLTALVQRVSTDDFILRLKNLKELSERNRKILQNGGSINIR